MLALARPGTQGCSLLRASAVKASTASPSSVLPRRYYGGIIRAIVSKHVESISDTLRPVLPPNLRKRPGLDGRGSRRTSGPNDVKTEPIELEDDISTTESQKGIDAETKIQTEVRRFMRLVPHPVAIITSTEPNAPPGSAFKGMTVSSFNTVTLNPAPVISFNVKTPSETYNAIRTSSRFLVHLLSPNETTARLALEFSKGQENVALNKQGRGTSFFQFTAPNDCKVPPVVRDGEPPRLRINQGEEEQRTAEEQQEIMNSAQSHFPFVFECRYLPQSTRIGDHVVIFGSVVNVFSEIGNQADTKHRAEELCLSYADTRFWGMGSTIPPALKGAY